MWLRSKSALNSHIHGAGHPFNYSWEELAFAEDASGSLGGFIWPPRSYSCHFCKREFRSAQALGGHMNVHRRDKARLKESVGPQNALPQHQNHTHNPSKSMVTQDLYQVSISISALASLKLPTQEKFKINALLSPFSSNFQQDHKQKDFCSVISSFPDSEDVILVDNSTSKPVSEKNRRKGESIPLDDDNCPETDLSMGWNLAGTPTVETPFDDDYDNEAIRCKRHKTAALQLPFFLKPCSNERYHFKMDILGHKTSSIEDMDLELRLGDSPTAK